MKYSRFFSGLFLSIALILMVAAFFMSMALPGTKPTLVSSAQEAQDRVVAAMDAICQGDFSAAEPYLLGQPSLGADRKPEELAGQLIWADFLKSLSYQLSGECYATDTGVAQDISLTYLDISSVTANLAQRGEQQLTQLQQEADHTSQIYDENGEYRQDVVERVLRTSVLEALKEDAKTITAAFTLQLVNRNGQWYIVPNSDFISALSGGIQ
jgi:hypothetical protein